MKKYFFLLLCITNICVASQLSDAVNSLCEDANIKPAKQQTNLPESLRLPDLGFISDEEANKIDECIINKYELLTAEKVAEAPYLLGIHFLNPLRTKRESSDVRDMKIVENFAKSAELGYIPAMTDHAFLVYFGEGCIKDENLALEEYKKAATLNDPLANYSVGAILKRKKNDSFLGLFGSNDEIKSWFKKACDLKLNAGCQAINHYHDNEADTFPLSHFNEMF